jgi:phosphofructokinase
MPHSVGVRCQVAEQVAAHRINGLLMAGGWAGYQAAHELHRHRQHYAALDIPIVCLPMTINNDVPGTELSIGSDTALNSIVADVDKIRQSAVASRRVFVVEVMGRDCGYLALLSGLATGAERIYLPEEGITLDDLTADVHALADGFRSGKRLGLIIRNENADPVYTTGFITSLFEKEGGELFDARQAILGHVQEGGDPSPFDRHCQVVDLVWCCQDWSFVAIAARYKGYRYPIEVIGHAVWLYHRFALSLRDVEELMLARGVVVTYETIRSWCAKFGPDYAAQLRRWRPRPGDKWHLDEVFVKINGTTH